MKQGTVCRVISDADDFFEYGEIVVVLEDSYAPYCAKESAYSPEKQIVDYSSDEYSALCDYELEVIEE